MESYLRLIIDHAQEGLVNMAVDEFLLRRSIAVRESNPILRFYQFSDSVMTVGYGLWSKVRKQLNGETQAIRRITGGGIVLHGADLVYSFVSPLERYPALRRPRESYRFIHKMLVSTLSHFGIEAKLFSGKCASYSSSHSEARRAEESDIEILRRSAPQDDARCHAEGEARSISRQILRSAKQP